MTFSESPAKRSGWTLEGGTGSEEKHFVYWKQLRRGGNVFYLCVFALEQTPSRLPEWESWKRRWESVIKRTKSVCGAFTDHGRCCNHSQTSISMFWCIGVFLDLWIGCCWGMEQSSVDLCLHSDLHFWKLYFSYCCSKYLKTRLSGLNWVVKVTITFLFLPLPRTLYLRNASRKSLSHSRMDWLEFRGQRFRSLSPQTCHQKILFFFN